MEKILEVEASFFVENKVVLVGVVLSEKIEVGDKFTYKNIDGDFKESEVIYIEKYRKKSWTETVKGEGVGLYIKNGEKSEFNNGVILYRGGSIDDLKTFLNIQKDEFYEKKQKLLEELDVDGNGIIDISESNDFNKLLRSRQNLIIEFEKNEGKTYIKNFIKLSNFLKGKTENIQSLFRIIKEDSKISHTTFDDYEGILKNQIHTYNLMLISSLKMITSLTDDDRITFYEIYETFDKLNVFSSNHEREVSIKLSSIENKIEDVIQSIHDMEINICNELMNLQFISQGISDSLEGFSDSLEGLSEGLSEINSSIQTNNILTGIQTYQLYKINKNTKSLRK
ncbi:hypothetical protein OAB54_07730 [Flavobacteriaceae bacterium]|nr:hypothetical protein [Flavobacteriaceae bacterium]